MMLRLPITRIGFLCVCGLCAILLSAQGQNTPPPMRTGNGSELEMNNLSWPREGQLPTEIPNTQLIQKRLEDYLEPLSLQAMRPSPLFPENPSEFMMKVILLHAVKDSIAGLHDETIARMNKMFLTENLLAPISTREYTPTYPWMTGTARGFSGSTGIVFVGLLDPVEIYRNWQRHKRAMRTQIILMTLFGDDTRLLTKAETDSIKREEEHRHNIPVQKVSSSTPITTLLQNDTIVAPSKPKFTAPLFGKERPTIPSDSLSGE